MGTKRFVCSFANVILTWQICGQRSSRAVESKRRALGNYFSERICYMFLAWISEFWRIIRIIRIYEFLNSDFSKFWKPNFSIFYIFRISRNWNEKLSGDCKYDLRATHHAAKTMPNKPLDNASNICESSNTSTFSNSQFAEIFRYYMITEPRRHKSSKIEVWGPPWMSHSAQPGPLWIMWNI